MSDPVVSGSRDAPESGASLIEYVLLVALIALAVLVAVGFLGNSLDESVSRSGSELFPVIRPPWLVS